MANVYCSDAQITARMPTDHADLNTSDERLAQLIKPASRWVDSRYPYVGEYATWVDEDTPDPVIQEATIAYALSLAFWIMTDVPDNPVSVSLKEQARDLLRVDPETGIAGYDSAATVDPVGMGYLTRDMDDERDNLEDVVQR